jgi:hypothetical protein
MAGKQDDGNPTPTDFDECWPSIDVDDDVDLPKGCITGSSPYYCVCDEDNGWTVDTSNTASGLCIPVCLQTGKDTNIAVDVEDECWNAEVTHAAPAPLLGLKVQNTLSTDNTALKHVEIQSSYLDYTVTRGSGC